MLRLRTLGGLSIENALFIAGATAHRRPLALLALLAVEGRQGLSRDKIVALLWPESDADHGRNSLSQVVSSLRRELGVEDVVIGAAELRLNPEVLTCDATEFEQRIADGDLETAVNLYKGPFLDGVFLKNTPEFERWVDQERARLQHAQGDALEGLATLAATRRDHVSAVRWWRQRANLFPTDSRAALRLMEALVASGDPAGALEHYRVHYDLLRDDLALAPDPALAEFAAAVRSRTGQPVESLSSVPGKTAARVAEYAIVAHGEAQSRDELTSAEVSTPSPTRAIASTSPARRRRVLLAAAAALLPGAAYVLMARSRLSVLDLEQRIERGDWEGAYRLAKAAPSEPGDSTLERLRSEFSWQVRITSVPPGAKVLRRPYSAVDAKWEVLGVTPIETIRLPFGASRLRFALAGHDTVDRLAVYVTITGVPVPVQTVRVQLDRSGSIPAGMVRVPGWAQIVDDERIDLGDFLIDRYEITNQQYKEFLAGRAYQRRDLWQYPFIRDGKTLTWDQAMALFTDQTGRPGPATWEAGDYPEGQDNYPVAGVSWYEAAAYARFVGKDLPTVHHWSHAVGRQTVKYAWLVPLSNVGGRSRGTAPVGQFRGMSWYGAFDMAGNVREWCLNETDVGRVMQGGGWNEPWEVGESTFGQSPFDRSSTNGIRLVQYLDDKGLDRARQPVRRERYPDFLTLSPVPDNVFRIYRRAYEYDRTPLRATLERTDTAASWIREKVSFDAAYGNEREGLYLFLPRRPAPPYQTVVLFPGDGVLDLTSIDDSWRDIQLDFSIKAGRALALPVYKGTLDRGAGTMSPWPLGSNTYKERVTQWAKDLQRAVDYLQTRSDLDSTRLAYYGYSLGGLLAPVMLAVEPRFRAAVVYVGGFSRPRAQPEVDGVTFAPRVRTPALLLSGRYDDVFPLETSARPMFQLLGTPARDKRQVVSDGGHFVPRPQLIRETLAWFDRYLGPVGTPIVRP